MQHTIRKNSCDSKEHKYNYATHTTCQSVLTSLDNLLFVYVEEKGQGIIMMVMLIFATHDIGPNTNLATYEKERGGIASVFQEFWHQGENTRSHDCWCVCKIHIIEEVEVMKLEDNFIYPGSIKGLEEKIYVQYVNWCHHHCQDVCLWSILHSTQEVAAWLDPSSILETAFFSRPVQPTTVHCIVHWCQEQCTAEGKVQ